MKQNIVVKFVLAMVLGLAGILYLLLLGGSIYEAVVFPQAPQKVTLSQAVQMDLLNKPTFLVFDKRLYVSITDAILECASVKQSGYKALSDKRRTDAVFTDAKKTAVVFFQVDGFYNCQELKDYEMTGELQRVYTRPVKYQSDTMGTIIIDADSDTLVFFFCTHCNPFQAASQPIGCVLLPFVMWGIFEYWKRQSRKKQIKCM